MPYNAKCTMDPEKCILNFEIKTEELEMVGQIVIYETKKKEVYLVEVRRIIGDKLHFNGLYRELMCGDYGIDKLLNCLGD